MANEFPPSMKFREVTADDVPSLFHVRTRTRENTMTLEELQRLGIDPRSVTETLASSTKGWVCEDAGRIVAFSMADRATGELLVIAVLPDYEGKGIGGRLMALAEEWLAASGCRRGWLTTDLDTTLRAYGFYRKRGWTDWKIERGLRWMELGLPPAKGEVTLQSVITCPECGATATEQMPTDSCIYFYECKGCRKLLRPAAGDCCVFCSYGSVKCPPMQLQKGCCA